MRHPIIPELHRAYRKYLLFLRDGGTRPALSRHVHNPEHSRGMLHPSSFGKCPLQEAWRREGMERAWEQKPWEREGMYHLMEQGSRVAEVVQEAFLWAYGACETPERDRQISLERTSWHQDTFFIDEYSQHDESLGIRGRIDGLLRLNNEFYLLEMKARNPHVGPKLSDAYQLMTYMLSTGENTGLIITIHRFSIKFWWLFPNNGGFTIVNEWGDRYDQDWNTPDTLNFDLLQQEISVYRQYVFGGKRLTPIEDPYNHPRGWCCFMWDHRPRHNKTTVSRTGTIKPRCEFFHLCHGEPDTIEVMVDAEGYMTAVGEEIEF